MDGIKEQERWIMSLYRYSEITGAMFFAKVAACMPAGPIQVNLNKHFADESMHSWYWTQAMDELGYKPIRLANAYQDAYLDAGGLPVNIMEILALTNVFEKRVIKQYAHHMKIPNLNPIIKQTIEKIVEDEKWHVYWINQALKTYAQKYGEDKVNKKIQHYKAADESIYQQFLQEHKERLDYVFESTVFA
ncbi:MAG: ferritin-like domain-containing protein [Gammaproteobacteria bacterium]|jgi:rubrerythrin|nr:ferritin-like domain-containing protein [Gammaproteobacteria bacterium]